MDKAYQPQDYEEKIYRQWEKGGFFRPPTASEAKKAGKKPFCIIMPPPNANDPLHTGHAMFVSIEDILTRYHRMKGKASLWLPGTDHAGIETQYVFEKKLAKKKQSRFNFDRQTLYQMIWDYVQENSGAAINQMKRLGASADWSRFKFTLDKDVVEFVLNTFIQLYNDGLVYRDERLVNYCTKCGTSFSELEIIYEEQKAQLYFIKYPFKDNPKEFVIVATTRPETMLGDAAVAINPKDKRYKNLVNKTLVLPLVGRKIPIIADKGVDPEFGTGALKITPAHDPNDFEMAQRHNLELIQVIGLNGKMNDQAGDYTGLNILMAREKIVEDLKEKGLLEKVKDYQHRVGTCYRCHRKIEPLPLPQFFIKTQPLAKKALNSLKQKETVVLGAGREKILTHWLKNIKDWNISRQIVWGIRMPVWYKVSAKIEVKFLDKNKKFVRGKINKLLKNYSLDEIKSGLQSLQAPKQTPFVISKTQPQGDYLQETDTFDTWFSSGQWPIVTLKTNQPADFKYYYPTSVMETGYDILPIWVMRMMLLGIYLTGQSPFQSVYLHGLVRDEHGRKMSKSLGNVINPLDLVEKYGADALRMALVISTTPGKDSAMGESKVRGMRNFTNKIWNAARFIKLNIKDQKFKRLTSEQITKSKNLSKNDQSFLKKLNLISQEITQLLDSLKIGLAAEKTYNYFWHWFCDEWIEKAKKEKVSYPALFHGLIIFLKLLHPFVPFVTEAVWQEIKNWRKYPEQMLIKAKWPKS